MKKRYFLLKNKIVVLFLIFCSVGFIDKAIGQAYEYSIVNTSPFVLQHIPTGIQTGTLYCHTPSKSNPPYGHLYAYNSTTGLYIPQNSNYQTLSPNPCPTASCGSFYASPSSPMAGSLVNIINSQSGTAGSVAVEYAFSYTINGNTVGFGGTGNSIWQSSPTASFTPSVGGSYTITRMVRGICGGVATVCTITINVSSPCSISASASSNPSTVTLGNSSMLSASALGGSGNYTYSWNNGLGNGISKTVSPTSTTTYNVTVTDNTNPSCTATAATTVNVTAPCNLSASASSNPSSINLGSSSTLSVSAFGGSGNYSYSWSHGLGSGSSKTVFPTSTTTYTVTVTDNNTGCTTTANTTISVTSCTPLSSGGSINATPNPVTLGYSVNINNLSFPSGGSGGTIQYLFEYSLNGSSYVAITGWVNSLWATSFTPPSVGTYTIRRRARRSVCTNEVYAITTLVVNPNCSVIVSATGNPSSITLGSSATLSASGSNGTGGYSYIWSHGLGSGATKNVSPTTTTTYTVTVTDASGCTATDNVTITVLACNLTADAGSNTSICSGASTTLTATASNGTTPYTFAWNNGLGNGASKTVSPTTTTTYTVTITDANNCIETDHVTVSVSPFPTATTTKTDAICGLNTGTITFTFSDEPTQTAIAFSYDGGNTYQTAVADNSTSVTYTGLASGTYSLYAKWGDNSCSMSLGSVTIGSNNDPTFCNPSFDFQKSLVKDTVRMEETVFYTFTFINNSGLVLSNVQFTDNLSGNAVFFSDPMNKTGGIQVVGNTLNSASANLTLNNIPIGTSSFQLAVDIPSGLSQGSTYCNQAQISNLQASHPNLPDTISSDNPNTPTIGDATCVPVKLYENCCNGIDDDGDGLCDKDDADCN